MPEVFVLAVQEINFFHSFILSFFIALTALCDQIMDNKYDTTSSQVVSIIAAIQWVYGMFTCIYLYGRKVPDEDESKLEEEEEEQEIDLDDVI